MGKKLTDKKREQIKAFYSSCGNMRETARQFGVSPSTVKSIVDENKDEVEHLRTQKKSEWIEEAWRTINMYVKHVQSDEVVKKTGARDSAILIGTLHDKMLKYSELELKREELEVKRRELEQKNKPPEQPNISVYIDALKGDIEEVFDDE